jgi:hypothetical protein
MDGLVTSIPRCIATDGHRSPNSHFTQKLTRPLAFFDRVVILPDEDTVKLPSHTYLLTGECPFFPQSGRSDRSDSSQTTNSQPLLDVWIRFFGLSSLNRPRWRDMSKKVPAAGPMLD